MSVVREEVVMVNNRPFWLNVIEVSDPETRKTHRDLSISGDDRLIGFGADEGPQDFKVHQNNIVFGGHALTITDTPGAYLIDGKPVMLTGVLSEHRCHNVVNGIYLGEDELP